LAAHRKKPPIILVFGETKTKAYDAQAVAHLIRGLLPHGVKAKVSPRREFLRLVKGNLRGTAPAAKDLARIVRAAEVRNRVVGVVKHEDTDEVEPSHVALATAIESVGGKIGCPVYAAAAAWELEAWLLLWPEVVGATRPSWRSPTEFAGKNVGVVRDAKAALARSIQPANLPSKERQRFPRYKESDSVDIARRVAETDMCRHPAGTSASYEQFISRVDDLAASVSC